MSNSYSSSDCNMNFRRKHSVYNWGPILEMFTVVISTNKIESLSNYLVTIYVQYNKCAKQ